MTIENITIGADPELFIINTKTGKVKSAISLIPGTKSEPFKINELGDGFAMQTDNILAEFNIPPATNINTFINNIESMKSYIRNYVKQKDKKYDILCSASQIVPISELRSKQAKAFGCDPDYCVYTKEKNPVPPEASKTNLRSAGFHIHIGYSNPNIEKSLCLVEYLDAFLGLPSIIIDTDNKRRELYGKAGCFRLCKYGVEYRTMSSFWLQSPSHLTWIWEQLKLAISAFKECLNIPNAYDIQDCINNNNVEKAKRLCANYNLCAEFSV